MSAGAKPQQLRSLRHAAAQRLQDAGVASPRVDVDLLLEHVLQVDRSRLPLIDQIDPDLAQRFQDLVDRRAAREPLQHLTGRAWFRRVAVEVGPGVFVPRPETELLAGWAIDRARDAVEAGVIAPVIVDLCTGSGAIAKSIADEVPTAKVYAAELDPGAHAWAERNLAGTGVELQLADLSDAFADLRGEVDVVVCNPPYIPLEAWESVAPEARDHDPHLALFSGDDGLDAMRALERRAKSLLKPGGWVGAEHADEQGPQGHAGGAPAVFASTGAWQEIRDHEDLAGRPRFTTARLAR